MLKLLIVEDEEIICETLARLTDWSSLGIELIGTCQDGVDAYHMILDECPDIVMTDINMPGDRKSTRLNSSHSGESRMPSSA